MRVLAISVGRIAPLVVGRGAAVQTVSSGIVKKAASTIDDAQPVDLGPLGFTGDEQFDLSNHGGPMRAVYIYCYQHYQVWRTMRLQALKVDEELPFGAMGENLTVEGMDETKTWIGDVLEIGSPVSVRLRVSAPREPCFKFSARMGFPHAAKMMVQSGYTGFYLEVMQTGTMRAGAPINLVPGERLVRVDEYHRNLYAKR
jgi:MOSC domain-containing protein YiiM